MREAADMKTRLMIFGTGAHARKVFHCAVALGHEVVGFVDENAAALSPVAGVTMIPAGLLRMPTEREAMFVAIGCAEVRKRLMDQCAEMGWEQPVLIHPSAWVSPDAVLNSGALVAAGAVVESASVIGRGAIVDIGAVIDHECHVGAYCHVEPGVVLRSHTIVPSPV